MTRFDRQSLRMAFGAYMTGVTVVTTRDRNGQPRGFTANSFTSVSLDPPLLLVCLDRKSASRPEFETAPGFAVNVLAEDQRDLANLFASPCAHRFAEVDWSESPTGSPLLAGVAAWFDCRRHDLVDGGDHVILLGRIGAFHATGANGLGYARGGYFVPGLEQSAITAAAAHAPVTVGAIVERDCEMLLVQDGEGCWRPPASGLDGGAGSVLRLKEILGDLGLDTELGPLYAVYENRATGAHSIYYRAQAGAGSPRRGRFFHCDTVPWDLLPNPPLETMLRRYVEEHRAQRFGIYYGTEESGEIQRLSPEPDKPRK